VILPFQEAAVFLIFQIIFHTCDFCLLVPGQRQGIETLEGRAAQGYALPPKSVPGAFLPPICFLIHTSGTQEQRRFRLPPFIIQAKL
jgi:hypothetical protein